MNKALVVTVLSGALMASPALAMVNPASAFCEEMGGRHETLTDATGAAMSVCHLPDGRIVEEWTLFRLYHGKVPASLDTEKKS